MKEGEQTDGQSPLSVVSKKGSDCPNGDHHHHHHPPEAERFSASRRQAKLNTKKQTERPKHTRKGEGKGIRARQPITGKRTNKCEVTHRKHAEKGTATVTGNANYNLSQIAVRTHSNWKHGALDRHLVGHLSVSRAALNVLTTPRASATLKPTSVLWAEVRQIRWSPECTGETGNMKDKAFVQLVVEVDCWLSLKRDVPWRLEGLQESKFKHVWVYDVFFLANYFWEKAGSLFFFF